jgi:hypothetical protein
MGTRMSNHMSDLSASAVMVTAAQSLPPYAPLVMPKQVLEAEVTLSGYVGSALAAMLSFLKPSFRDAN